MWVEWQQFLLHSPRSHSALGFCSTYCCLPASSSCLRENGPSNPLKKELHGEIHMYTRSTYLFVLDIFIHARCSMLCLLHQWSNVGAAPEWKSPSLTLSDFPLQAKSWSSPYTTPLCRHAPLVLVWNSLQLQMPTNETHRNVINVSTKHKIWTLLKCDLSLQCDF